jgi:membrane protein YqaA with SNARE-associated domain
LFRHLADLVRQLTTMLVAWGPAGILFLSVLDSAGMPVAGVFDALLIVIAVERPSAAWLCAAVAVVGSTLGNTMLFWMSRKGGSRFMAKAAPAGRAAKFRAWFLRYGIITVFIPALIPIPLPMKLFVISAGITGTALAEFVTVVLVARFLRYFGEAWLGIALGRESTTFLTSHVWHFVLGAVLLFVALYGVILWRDRGPRSEHSL